MVAATKQSPEETARRLQNLDQDEPVGSCRFFGRFGTLEEAEATVADLQGQGVTSFVSMVEGLSVMVQR